MVPNIPNINNSILSVHSDIVSCILFNTSNFQADLYDPYMGP